MTSDHHLGSDQPLAYASRPMGTMSNALFCSQDLIISDNKSHGQHVYDECGTSKLGMEGGNSQEVVPGYLGTRMEKNYKVDPCLKPKQKPVPGGLLAEL